MRRSFFGSLRACVVLGVAAAAVGPVFAQPKAADDREVLIDELQRVVQTGRSKAALEETTIVGLRTLGDPRLAPLFAALADSPRWESRVHGMLGLAELDPTHRVNTLMVSDIKDPQVRAVVVGEALKLDLVDQTDLRELVEIHDLEPTLRLVLLSKLRGLGGAVTAEEVEAVVAELPPESVGMRVYGGLVASDIRGDNGSGVWSQIEAVKSEATREAVLSVVLRQVRGDPLKAVTGFVDQAWAWSRGRSLLEVDVVGAMIKQDPPKGSAAWGELWSGATDLSRRIVLAGLLAELSPIVPAELFAKVSADPDPCVQKLGAFGAAVARGGAFGDELFELMAQEHRISTASALQAMSEIPLARRAVASARVLERVLDREKKDAAPRYGFEVARVLAKDDMAGLNTLIERAAKDKDSAAMEMVLAAVLEQDPVLPWGKGAAPEMPDRRSRVLASLIEARTTRGADLTAQQIEDLQRIAAGRELLPPAMRVQAAWLALCAAGQEREALARIMAPDAPAKPGAPAGD